MPALSSNSNRPYQAPATRKRNARSRARSVAPRVVAPKPAERTRLARVQARSYGSQAKQLKTESHRQKARAVKRRHAAQRRLVPKDEFKATRGAQQRAVQALSELYASDPEYAAKLRAQATGKGRRKPFATIGLSHKGSETRAIRRFATGTTRAIVEDPAGTAKGTARGLKDAIVGAVPAAVSLAVETGEGTVHGDPLRGVKHAGKDYASDLARRYGPLFSDDPGAEKRYTERIKKEGLAAEALDATAVIGGVGGAASRGLSAALRRSAAKAAAAGKPLTAAERLVTAPRRRKRTRGGGSEEQRLGKGAFQAHRQKHRDERAFRGQQRQVARADREAAAAHEAGDSLTKKGRVDAVVRQATAAGEVVPSRLTVGVRKGSRGVVRTPSLRKVHKGGRVDAATKKSRRLSMLRRVERDEGIAGGGRGAGKAYASLNRSERRAYKTVLQAAPKSLEAGVAWAERRLARLPADAPEAPILRRILSEPGKHFTPRLLALVAEESARGARAAEFNPALGETVAERQVTAELRRRNPQFATLGIQRRGTKITDRERYERAGRDRLRREGGKAQTEVERAQRGLGAAEETARRAVGRSNRTLDKTIERADRAVRIHLLAEANHRRRAGRARSEKTRTAHEHMADAAGERAAKASARRDEASGNRHQEQSARLHKRVVAARGRVAEAGKRRDRVHEDIRAAAKVGRELRAARRRGVELVDAEDVQAFLKRGAQEADEAGYGDPAYFQSAPRERVLRSLFTIGGGHGATKPGGKYKRRLFDQGMEDGSFTTYAQGLARSYKTGHNWALVSDVTDAHALRGPDGAIYRGTPEQLRRIADEQGFAEDSFGLFNPGVFREAGDLATGGDVEAGRLTDQERILSTPEDDAWGATLEGEHVLGQALTMARDSGRFAQSNDWVMVAKGALDELEADTKPSGWLGRSFDIVKGKQARILLGTSPAWLQFQVASNMLLTTMAGVGPLEIVRANRWWRRLSDEEKAAIEPYVGMGHFHDSLEQQRIGAAANNNVVNAWRAMKNHPFWHKPRRPLRGAAVSQLNPFDALFRVDNSQNNVFRRAVLYNRAKREAYARMGANAAVIQRLQDRLVGHLTGHHAIEQQMMRLSHDTAALERHAEAVRDFLGDYNTYTARERRTLGRAVMFYGFLRFSLRFTFYTMPVKHPVMTAIIGQLGRMQSEEIRRLLGGDELPWAMGKFFFTKDGKLKSVNVARANPFLNSVTELNPTLDPLSQLRNGLRFLPPVYVALANQAFSKSSFRDKPFRVDGETTGRRSEEYGFANRAAIFFNEMARLNAMYRVVDTAAAKGTPQGDDSILGHSPLKFKDPRYRADIAESQKRFEQEGGALGSIGRDIVPFIPETSVDPEIAAKIRKARGKSSAGGVKLSPAELREIEAARREAAAAGAGGLSPADRREIEAARAAQP